MVLKRKIYDKKLVWQKAKNGGSVLLLDGASCVGKSFLCEMFGKKQGA